MRKSVLAQSSSGLTVFTALQAPTAEVRQILSDTAQLQLSDRLNLKCISASLNPSRQPRPQAHSMTAA